MMNCKQVSTLVSMGDIDTAPMAQRLGVWMHLAMCRHCRAFRQQLVRIGQAARVISTAFEREPLASFEAKILSHLGS
jgi:predicted anti-sigma-YlaC factor YlaD